MRIPVIVLWTRYHCKKQPNQIETRAAEHTCGELDKGVEHL